MRKVIFIFFIFFSYYAVNAQIGVVAHYEKKDFKTWNGVLKKFDSNNKHNIFQTSYKVGLDYGFTLSSLRVSFYPEINYLWSTYSLEKNAFYIYNFNLKQFGFNFKTQIYPLDLYGNRSLECPSFYKGMDRFNKGWFFQFSPEIVYSSKSMVPNLDIVDELLYSNFIFIFNMGTGLDIGITKNISISPVIKYAFSIGERWDGFSEFYGEASHNDGTAESHFSVGLRLGIWL